MKYKYSDWMLDKETRDGGTHSFPMSILSLEEAAAEIDDWKKRRYKIGLTSGGYDPIHPGHISCIYEAATRCDILVVVVNGDEFLRRKKGHAFMPLKVRAQIASSIKWVSFTVPFEPTDPSDMTVNEALEALKPHRFFKGGDRVSEATIPEWNTCVVNKIEVVTGMGDKKLWSSSDFLRKWDERVKE
jgi:D-beta-D-heptose 7-phosphate kinase/D-beta-D-heptose 1-phosphate adenosyltransferase